MREIVLSSYLNAPLDRIWTEVQRPELLSFVARPIVEFSPVVPSSFPEAWEAGDYIVSMAWRGIVPLGRQTISISHPEAPSGTRQLRDNGHSAMIKRWDHLITLELDGSGTRYTDRVAIEAGILTLPVARFAESFYAHRQRRWQKLVDSDFDYGIA
ncbi:hypothetical protein CUV01_19510 (plasmid) [Paracoccus tegillarcae]|uniref:SRPBCC family protein n=1 Tax=Paracoccus tegillarcae TaxID=1529068 RepID=A0A2K9F9A2_9RHOB|nr:hypothetical protein CUV01_19510 [Paracoccus tegillarcae]